MKLQRQKNNIIFYFDTTFINCSNNLRVVTVRVLKNNCYSETRASDLIYTLDQRRRQSKTYLISLDLAHGPDHTA